MRTLPADTDRLTTVELNVPSAAISYGFSPSGLKWRAKRTSTGNFEIAFEQGVTVISAVVSGASTAGFIAEVTSIAKNTFTTATIGHTGAGGDIGIKAICTVLDKRL